MILKHMMQQISADNTTVKFTDENGNEIAENGLDKYFDEDGNYKGGLYYNGASGLTEVDKNSVEGKALIENNIKQVVRYRFS